MPLEVWQQSFPANLEGPARLRAGLSSTLTAAGFGEAETGRILLAASEVFTNIVRHGQPKATVISVTLEPGETWRIDIADDGGAFEDGSRAVQTAQAQDLGAELLEGGMGLALASQALSDLTYKSAAQSDDGLNHHLLSFTAPPAPDRRPLVHLIEDDPAFQRLVSLFVRDRFRIETFNSAEDYLAAKPATPDVILSDITLPGLDGFGLRKALAEREGGATLPFLFLTGRQDAESRAAATPLGIDDYLEKPVDKDRLLAVLDRVLNRSRQLTTSHGDRVDRRIMQAMKPRLLERIGGFQIDAIVQPANVGGGDLLRQFSLAGWEAIVLVDVMGHDETAAFLAQAISGCLSGLARDASLKGPADLLGALSEVMSGDPLFSETLASALVLGLEPGGLLRLASAGHPAPLLLKRAGHERIEANGPLLGLPPLEGFQEASVQLGAGDRLLAFSDGLAETSEEVEALASTYHARGTAEAAVAQITNERTAPADDATLIILTPPSPAALREGRGEDLRPRTWVTPSPSGVTVTTITLALQRIAEFRLTGICLL